MIKNYVVISLRNIVKHKLYAAIGLAGLSIGLSVAIFTHIFSQYERSYDQFFDKSDRTYVPFVIFRPGGPMGVRSSPNVPTAARHVIQRLAEVENIAWALTRDQGVRVADLSAYQTIRFVDDSFFDIFDLDYITGGPPSTSRDANWAVISESAAKRYFSDSDPLGEVIGVEGKASLRVVGVFRDLPQNTHFETSIIGKTGLEVIAPVRVLAEISDFTREGSWYTLSADDWTYVTFPADFDTALIESEMRRLIEAHTPERAKELIETIRFRPLTKQNLYHSEAAGFPLLLLLQSIGFLILGVAVLNYINLAVAQSFGRVDEVGTRITLGAERGDLTFQFLSESLVLTIIAAIIALAIVLLLLPFVNDFLNREIGLAPAGNLNFIWFIAVLTIGSGLAAGAYPAFMLSRLKVSNIYQKAAKLKGGGTLLRGIMLFLQFFLAAVLTALAVMVVMQNSRMQSNLQTFNPDRTIVLDRANGNQQDSYEVLRRQLLELPGVESVSGASQSPTQQMHAALEVRNPARPEDAVSTLTISMDESYLSMFGARVLAGRLLDRDRGDVLEYDSGGEAIRETVNVVVNETAVERLGWESPEEAVGKVLRTRPDSPPPNNFNVVGVIEDRNFIGLFTEMSPMIFMIDPERFGQIIVRISDGYGSETVAGINAIWNDLYPDQPLVWRYLREIYLEGHAVVAVIAAVVAGLGALAVIIASLGLFGMASLLLAKRRREIGIRRIIGADSGSIIRLLLRQLAAPIVCAAALAVPVTLFAGSAILSFFADPVEYGVALAIIGSLLMLLLTLLISVSHAWRETRESPLAAFE